MGFLMGAYGKLMAGKLVRDLQFQMTSVQSRLRRVTREVGLKEKMYSAQERNMKQMMQAQMQQGIYGDVMRYAQSNPQMGIYLDSLGQSMYGGGIAGAGIGLQAFSGNDGYNASILYSRIQQQWQMQFTQANTLWQNIFEMEKESDLQALKDLEDDLQTEKDNLESRLKIAQAEYDAYKEEEKQGVKSLTPDYTGQG